MPLPSGNWKANINGWEDVLSITATERADQLGHMQSHGGPW